mgnify:FL=1
MQIAKNEFYVISKKIRHFTKRNDIIIDENPQWKCKAGEAYDGNATMSLSVLP